MINHAAQGIGMVLRTLRRTPDAGQTKLAAPTGHQVFRAVHLAPRMMAARYYPPSMGFGVT